MTDADQIKKQIGDKLLFRFPDKLFSVFWSSLDRKQLEINYDAYATEVETKKIKKFIDKTMETEYQYIQYSVQRMPF